jgi:hypothetical protein
VGLDSTPHYANLKNNFKKFRLKRKKDRMTDDRNAERNK